MSSAHHDLHSHQISSYCEVVKLWKRHSNTICGGHFEFGRHLGFGTEIILAPYPDLFVISKPTFVPNFMLFPKIAQYFNHFAGHAHHPYTHPSTNKRSVCDESTIIVYWLLIHSEETVHVDSKHLTKRKSALL